MINAFLQKLALSPFYYTLLYQASTVGTLVINPLFYVFPQDDYARWEDVQFMVGDALLVSPVVNKGRTSVLAYFPKGTTKTVWYDWFTGGVVSYGGGTLNLTAPLDFTNIHQLGGTIVPYHPHPINNTQATRLTPYALRVALDSNFTAHGSLYADDGESVVVGSSYTQIQYNVSSSQTLAATVVNAGYPGDPGSNFVISEVILSGLEGAVQAVEVNGHSYSYFVYSPQNNVMSVSKLNLKVNSAWTIQWYI